MGSKVGRQKGDKIVTRKMKKAKRYIRRNYSMFGGCLSATECMRAAQITKSTFYRYLHQMRDEDEKKGIIWPDEMLLEDLTKSDLTVEEIREKVKNFYTAPH